MFEIFPQQMHDDKRRVMIQFINEISDDLKSKTSNIIMCVLNIPHRDDKRLCINYSQFAGKRALIKRGHSDGLSCALRNIFQILLNQTEIRLYLPCTD